MTFEYEWLSSPGTITSDNRDHCGIAERPDATLYVVIDGATRGQNGGDLARELAHQLVEQFLELGKPFAKIQISKLLQNVHKNLRRRFPADSASLFILVQKSDGSIMTAHAGDCRLGRLKFDKPIEWLSKPHTLANAIEDVSDPELITNPSRHSLTRSFRPRQLPDMEYGEFAFSSGDAFLIATDGFWAELNSSEQREHIEGKTPLFEKDTDDRSCLMLQDQTLGAHTSQPTSAGKLDNFYFRSTKDK